MTGPERSAGRRDALSRPGAPAAACRPYLAWATAISRGSTTPFFTARISAITLTAISGGLAADIDPDRAAQTRQRCRGQSETVDHAPMARLVVAPRTDGADVEGLAVERTTW